MEELALVLHRVDEETYLGQNNGGVRYLWMVEEHACKRKGHRGSRTVAFLPTSLQIPEEEVLLLGQ
jgi:hypothetical protein